LDIGKENGAIGIPSISIYKESEG